MAEVAEFLRPGFNALVHRPESSFKKELVSKVSEPPCVSMRTPSNYYLAPRAYPVCDGHQSQALQAPQLIANTQSTPSRTSKPLHCHGSF